MLQITHFIDWVFEGVGGGVFLLLSWVFSFVLYNSGGLPINFWSGF